jgi:hypothetical protein
MDVDIFWRSLTVTYRFVVYAFDNMGPQATFYKKVSFF